MILYHGSNQIVKKPKILTPNRYLDFGNGFYTTSTGVLSKAQTLDALKVKKLFNQYVFTNESALKYLKYLKAEEK